MNNEEKFIAKMFHYINGELRLIIEEFDRLEEAIEAGIKAVCHSFKIYNSDGDLCHDSHGDDDTYA